MVLKLHLMRLADGEDAFSAFCNVQNDIVQEVQELQVFDQVPIHPPLGPPLGPFGHSNSKKKFLQIYSNFRFLLKFCWRKDYILPQLPANNPVISLQTVHHAVDPNRLCWICRQAQAALGTWVCHNCLGNCWSCKKIGGQQRFGLYSTCDECEKSRKCLFCELTDVAATFHYGAPACETCKGRFRSYTGLKKGGHISQPKACAKGRNCTKLSQCPGCWAAKCVPVWNDISKKELKLFFAQ